MRKILLIAFLIALPAMHAEAIDLQKLTRETQRSATGGGQVTIVWWMPQAWWDSAMSASAMLTPEGKAQALAMLNDYTIFAVMRARVAGADLDARPRAELLANARCELNGAVVEPVASQDLGPGAQVLLVSFKPMLANMLGKLGQGIELVIYPNRQDGRTLVDATQPGTVKYTLYDQTFTWRLPLASLLPVKVDPKTGEEFPGDYSFNPYTGAPLAPR